MIVFDIETGPQDEDCLRSICPPFDESEVKCGNIKDPEKIKAKIDQARDAHFATFLANAALSAATGQVVAIGIYNVSGDASQFIVLDATADGCDESGIINSWWSIVRRCIASNVPMAGHNIFGFDLPFLVQRSWILGIDVPVAAVDISSKWTNWHRCFVDTMKMWQLGTSCKSNFDLVGKLLGTGGKSAGDHGAMFHELIKTDRDAAIAYLENDCRQPAEWLRRFGFIA